MLFYIVCFGSINLSLAYEDPHKGRCTRNVTIEGNVFVQEHYCCRHYMKRNNGCVECPEGFTSDDGVNCLKCNNGYYGRRCAEKCQCDINRCDTIQGCVYKHVSFGKQTTIETTILSRRRTSNVTNTLTDEIVPTRQSSSENTETRKSQFDLLIYAVTVTGLIGIIFIIGLCYCCHKYRKKSQDKISLTRADLPNATNESIELNVGIYHLIDESKMVDLNIHINPYLEVVDSSTNSDSYSSTNEDNANSYLHSYNSLITETENHAYEKRRSESQMTNALSITNDTKKGEEDNWGPCQSFTDISKADCNEEYTTTIHVVQRSETSSSETSSDTDERACSGYLSPLTDNENVYDISVSG